MELRQAGMEKAAEVWEMLENLPTPIPPVDIYKAASAMKCSEFISRIRTHKIAPEITRLLIKFMDDILAQVGADAGSVVEGARVLAVVSTAMPLTDEVFNDPAAYAQRQHVYDGLLLLSAARLGKEAETKKVIDELQESVTQAVMASYFEDDPGKPQVVN
jgi:hypothetical protein